MTRVVLGLVGVLLWASHARATDRLSDLLLDAEAGARFTRSLLRSFVVVTSRKPVAPEVARVTADGGLAVCIEHAGARTLVTMGGLVVGASEVRVRSPSGRWLKTEGWRTLGDGGLATLTVRDPWLFAELVPLPLAKLQPRETPETPTTKPTGLLAPFVVFTVAGVGGTMPSLARGTVIERLDGPPGGFLSNDLDGMFGLPLVTADGALVGINVRRHPDRERHWLAVSCERLDEWLRPARPPDRPAP